MFLGVVCITCVKSKSKENGTCDGARKVLMSRDIVTSVWFNSNFGSCVCRHQIRRISSC